MIIEVKCSIITIIRNLSVVLGSQLIKISPDLDNLVADEKQLGIVCPLKLVLNMKFKTLVSEILESKRMKDS